MVANRPDLIFVGYGPFAAVVKNHTQEIPIVFTIFSDPVGQGLVASLARPGGNVTGVSTRSQELAGKRLQLLKEVLPHVKRIGLVRRVGVPQVSETTLLLEELNSAAARLGLQFVEVEHENLNAGEFGPAFAQLLAQRVDAVATVVAWNYPYHREFVANAARARLPVVGDMLEFAETGGLMSFSVSSAERYRKSAEYVDRILRGAKPAELPVEEPTVFELVVNLKTARARHHDSAAGPPARRSGDRMRRRQFIVSIGGALAAALAHAQQRQVRRVGFLAFADNFSRQSPLNVGWRTIEEILAQEGFREGDNLVIERRHAAGKQSSLGNAARELVAQKPEVVVAYGSQAIDALQAAGRGMPIVGYTSDAVALGYAASYARPGGRVTGVSPSTLPMAVKQLELLVAIAPGLRRIAWLRNSPNTADRGQKAFAARVSSDIAQASAQLGVIAVPFDAAVAEEFDGVIAEIARQGFGAVLIPADILYVNHRQRLAARLLDYRLPSASMDMQMLDAGLLLAYGAVVLDGVRRMGHKVVEILRGVPPGEIPFEFIERFQLGINLKTAKSLGIKVPQSVLLRADRVIE